MGNFRPIALLLSLLILLALPVSAQESENSQVTANIGPFELLHPEDWTAFAGQNGTIIIAQRDPASTGIDASTIAENAVIVQLRTYGLNRIPAENPSAEDIMLALLTTQNQAGAPLPEVTSSSGDNLQFARASVGTAEQAAVVYTSILNEATFAIIIATTQGTADLEANESAILDILDTVTLNFEAGDYTEALARYADLAQSRTPEGFPILGNPEAPVQFVEISSFDCPACLMFHTEVFPILLPRIIAGEVAFIYVPVFGTGSLPDGDSAARAALCATDFWAYHDRLFDLQAERGFAFLYERLQLEALTLGTDPAAFDACFVSEETTAILQSAFDYSATYMERLSTPTLLVNNQPVPFSINSILLAIETALAGTEQE